MKTKFITFIILLIILLIMSFMIDYGMLSRTMGTYVSIILSSIVGVMFYDYYYNFKMENYRRLPKNNYIFNAKGYRSAQWGYDTRLQIVTFDELHHDHPVLKEHCITIEILEGFSDLHIIVRRDCDTTHEVVGIIKSHSHSTAYEQTVMYCQAYKVPEI